MDSDDKVLLRAGRSRF